MGRGYIIPALPFKGVWEGDRVAKQERINPILAAFWNEIQNEVQGYWKTPAEQRARGSLQHNVWERVKARHLEETGNPLKGVRIFDMNNAIALATSLYTSTQAFANAPMNAEIDRNMISRNINSRLVVMPNETPRYQVRFQHFISDNGNMETKWRNVTYTLDMPTTKDALLAELQIGAQAMADSYGEGHIGIGNVEISVV